MNGLGPRILKMAAGVRAPSVTSLINKASTRHVSLRTKDSKNIPDITSLFAFCKGGNFNIHIWA